MTNGAHASVCWPATVVLSTIVPRGRTSFSAVGSPDSEPVQSTTMSYARSSSESESSVVAIPIDARIASFSGCLPMTST